MKPTVARALCASLFLTGVAFATPSSAQGQPGSKAAGPGYEMAPEIQRFRMMAGIMGDMSQQMARMQQEMAKGELAPGMRKQMSRQLEQMSGMMKRMSGLIDRPSMKDEEAQKQLADMRKRMDAMRKDPPMGPAKK